MPGRLRDPGPSVKGPQLDKALREQGDSKETSARIAHAAARTSRRAVGRAGGETPPYEDWTTSDLRRRAAEIGITGRSRMRKGELIAALRDSRDH